MRPEDQRYPQLWAARTPRSKSCIRHQFLPFAKPVPQPPTRRQEEERTGRWLVGLPYPSSTKSGQYSAVQGRRPIHPHKDTLPEVRRSCWPWSCAQSACLPPHGDCRIYQAFWLPSRRQPKGQKGRGRQTEEQQLSWRMYSQHL